MLSLNTAVLNQNFSEALQDADFRKSSFFPTNPPIMGDNEFKEMVIEVYQVYQDHKQSLFECVFGRLDTMETILSLISENTVQGLASCRKVSKVWLHMCDGLLTRKWNLLTKQSIIPYEMSKINAMQQSRPAIIKLHALSKHICPEVEGTTLKNTPINPENIEKITYDNALQIVWRTGLIIALQKLNVPNLPEAEATANEISIFLQDQSAVVGQITTMSHFLALRRLTVIPREFNLLTGLTGNIILTANNIETIQNLDNCPALTMLRMHNNKIRQIQGLNNCQALTELVLSKNNISQIQGLNNCQALTKLNLSENNISQIQGLNNCQALTELNLYKNNISQIGEDLSNLTALTKLNLSENNISQIGEDLSNLTALTELNLSENNISQIGEDLSNLTALTELNL